MNHYLLFFVLAGSLLQTHAQPLPFGIRFNTGIGAVIYDAPTRKYINTTVSSVFAVSLNYKNIFSNTIFSQPFSRINDSINISGIDHPPTDKLQFNFQSWTIGYSFLFPDQRLSIDPYVGMHKTFVENDNGKTSYGSQLGSCGGVYLYYYNKPIINEKVQWYYFLNNRLCFPQLYKLNNELGHVYYAIEIGFGVRWGSMKEYWQRKY